LNIYIAPIQGIYSEALSVLAYMMLNVVMNEYAHYYNYNLLFI